MSTRGGPPEPHDSDLPAFDLKQLRHFLAIVEQGHFGRAAQQLGISKQGISNGKETIAWDQVKGINLDRGVINIQKEGKWFNWKSATVGGTPNVFVFLALVDQIAGLNKKK